MTPLVTAEILHFPGWPARWTVCVWKQAENISDNRDSYPLIHPQSVFWGMHTPDVSLQTLDVLLQIPGCVDTDPWMCTIFWPELLYLFKKKICLKIKPIGCIRGYDSILSEVLWFSRTLSVMHLYLIKTQDWKTLQSPFISILN